MANNNQYRSLGTFWFKEKHYQMFANDHNRVAFLIIDEEGKYHYPTLQELVEVTLEFKKKKDIKFILDDNNKPRKIKKSKFIPKIRKGLITFTLTGAVLSSILGACATSAKIQEMKQEAGIEYEYDASDSKTNDTISVSKDTNVIVEDEEINELLNNYSSNFSESSEEVTVTFDDSDVLDDYSELLASADDSYDYKWASDYYETASHNNVFVRDSSAYEHVYGYAKPTQSEITSLIQKNSSIDSKYKTVMTEFTNDLYKQAPDADLSVFKHNLETMKIVECSDSKMTNISGNAKTSACYDVSNNIMYFHEGIDFSTTNARIEAYHEWLHSVRNDKFKEGSTKTTVKFYDGDFGGAYTDEALVTNFAIQMAGLDVKSTYYTLQCSYYRVILDALGDNYTLSDYINHSINDLTTKMDKYMGDQTGYGQHIISLIDSQASMAYSNEITPDKGNSDELYNYMMDMYCNAHLTEGMTPEEANEVFENFYNEIFFNYDHISKYYDDLNVSQFYMQFEKNCQELGISTSLSR